MNEKEFLNKMSMIDWINKNITPIQIVSITTSYNHKMNSSELWTLFYYDIKTKITDTATGITINPTE